VNADIISKWNKFEKQVNKISNDMAKLREALRARRSNCPDLDDEEYKRIFNQMIRVDSQLFPVLREFDNEADTLVSMLWKAIDKLKDKEINQPN
jgi:hypothetical protein